MGLQNFGSVGSVSVFWGSMFSGKTTALVNRLSQAGVEAICFKPLLDDRDAVDVIKTHDGLEFPVTAIESPLDIPYLLDEDIATIGIDEASLFLDDKSLLPIVELLRNSGYDVIITGLDMTAEGEPFGQMPQLAAIADTCIKFHTVCAQCEDQATISRYLGEKKSVVETGGADKYEPLCRDCWNLTR